MNLLDALRTTVAIAHAAGEIVLKHYHAARPAQRTKTSAIDIVTAADTETEALIVAALLREFPTHHIVGEEGGGYGVPLESADYLWFVDPIDGTVNFASKIPHFCTSIALTTPQREPLVGVIYDPTRGELFSAFQGGGAFLNGQKLAVSDTPTLLESVIVSGFPYDKHTNPDNNLKEWGAFLTKIRGERRFGSAALDCAYVAAGRMDGYWERSLKPWDVMAGILLVREAGGMVTDYAGGNLPQLDPDGRFVVSNGQIHSQMLEVLASV